MKCDREGNLKAEVYKPVKTGSKIDKKKPEKNLHDG